MCQGEAPGLSLAVLGAREAGHELWQHIAWTDGDSSNMWMSQCLRTTEDVPWSTAQKSLTCCALSGVGVGVGVLHVASGMWQAAKAWAVSKRPPSVAALVSLQLELSESAQLVTASPAPGETPARLKVRRLDDHSVQLVVRDVQVQPLLSCGVSRCTAVLQGCTAVP